MLEPTAVLLAHADGSPASTSFTPGSLGANDPFDRLIAYAGADGIAAGIVRASGRVSSDQYPFSEMIVVHAGGVELRSQAQTLRLSAGESAVIARGTALEIDAQAESLWTFCADTQRVNASEPGLTALPAHTLLSPSAAPDEAILLSPPPQCRSHSLFVEEATNLRIGVWDSTPYTRQARPHKLHELMHLIEGSVTLQTADGTDLTVNTGDTVFVPQNAPCAWTSHVYVRKIYVVK
ncbi:cupin domain-containing protein [Pseudomonas sp. SWRI196]|uniref:Cupin domain-containing protein n=1 Tax=Pseudomonas tehranensis TaxID=2745502 RepID=A0ABR6UNR4_9PSED|nr:cupin domain-containing protein [Pseudomonas tehranensis]MBC3346209.1 cupin domain-containing protein [Pseudomonas tehranensis]